MPELGLNLSIESTMSIPSYAQLMKSAGSDLYLDARKANGISQGINSPLVNPWVDLTKNGNNVTFQNLAGTTSDGWDLQAVVNSNGSVIDYSNIIGNANLVDSNADGLADGYSQASTTNRTCVSGVQKFTATAQFGGIRKTDVVGVSTSKYAIIVGVKSTVVGSAAIIVNQGSNLIATSNLKSSNTITGAFDYIGGIYQIQNNGTFEVRIVDARASLWTEIEITEPIVIPLTDNTQITDFETNQLQRQLTALECDRIFQFVATTGQTKVSARPFLKLDGVDTVGIIPNNPSVDIVGLDEFEIDRLILTPSTIVFGYLIAKNLENTTNLQHSVAILANGSIEARLNANAYTVAPIGTIVSNTIYNIVVKRQSGRLICLVNGVETYNQANVVSIVTQPNFRLGAISTNVGGTTHSTFSNVYTGILSIAKNPDFAKLSSAWAKVVKDYI